MTFLEWRKLNFFDLKPDADKNVLSDISNEWNITDYSAGTNHLVLCDSSGQIHLISRLWQVQKSFTGYELTAEFVHQPRNSTLLITIGQDEPGVNPLIKVWDTSRPNTTGIPHCCRITRAIPGNRPVQVTCFCVHETLTLMVVGFMDGSLVIYRGDIARERGSKQKVLRDAYSSVTGLCFKSTGSLCLLYVATESSILCYNVAQKDKEVKSVLDKDIGCNRKCCVLSETIQEGHFLVGRKDAIYCYTADGRGPCYPVDGEKTLLKWFRNYLVIVANTTRSHSTNENLVTVLDIHNKFIVFSATIPTVQTVLSAWNTLYLIDTNNRFHRLDEKDLQSKLTLLFKKNLYDVAIRIAKSHQYDSDGMMEIFKQYGDHLCDKGDHTGAIDQYIKTIGKLESSYVIRKFVNNQNTEALTKYLQALHKQCCATEDHMSLLLNCYTKLNNTASVFNSENLAWKDFVMTKGDVNFNADIAIKACRQYNPNEALQLAKAHGKHNWYIKLQIEDQKNYKSAIDYISLMNLSNIVLYMKKYGKILLEHAPQETTHFLKLLCTSDYNNLYTVAIDPLAIDEDKPNPEDYIHMFGTKSEYLVEFLEYLVHNKCHLTTDVYNTLIQHYVYLWKEANGFADKANLSSKIFKILLNPAVKYDVNQALIICHLYGYSKGILLFYEQLKMYEQILHHYMDRNDTHSALACCRRFGPQEPNLWIQALWMCLKIPDTTNSPDFLREILDVIARDNLLSPQLVIDALCTDNNNITLGHIRNYIGNQLANSKEKTEKITESTRQYRTDIDSLKVHLDTLKNGNLVIQRARCAACHHPLELPTIHFFCEHSYHQHCFQSFCEEGGECPACQPQNQTLLDLLKIRQPTDDIYNTFLDQLQQAGADGFSVVAEYFRRGVFSEYKVVREDMTFKDSLRTCVDSAHSTDVSKKPEKTVKIQNRSTLNPFEEEYDETMNPFSAKNPFDEEDELLDDTNPFRE